MLQASEIPMGRHGIYIGSRADLKDKGALLQAGKPGKALAQFDDVKTGLGYGWHEFDKSDFKVDRR